VNSWIITIIIPGNSELQLPYRIHALPIRTLIRIYSHSAARCTFSRIYFWINFYVFVFVFSLELGYSKTVYLGINWYLTTTQLFVFIRMNHLIESFIRWINEGGYNNWYIGERMQHWTHLEDHLCVISGLKLFILLVFETWAYHKYKGWIVMFFCSMVVLLYIESSM